METLEKAFVKAYKNGWRDVRYGNKLPLVIQGVDYISTIFNHDFAKALWGEERADDDTYTLWEYHLQEMVIADDPIKYLGEHLED